jgi:threonine dehydratase
MMEAGIDLDTIVVPVGGGNLIAATLLAVRALNPDLTVIGVQSTAAPAATFSWLAGETVLIPSRTVAGGLATQHPGALSLRVMNALLERMLLVGDDDLIRAIGLTYELEGQVVEPAGAAAVAAVECHSDVIPGERLGLLVTGSCIGPQDLCRALRSVSESTSPM